MAGSQRGIACACSQVLCPLFPTPTRGAGGLWDEDKLTHLSPWDRRTAAQAALKVPPAPLMCCGSELVPAMDLQLHPAKSLCFFLLNHI